MDFDTWLSQRMFDLKTDESVFGPYIKSIVEEDDDPEDKIEALDGILAELGDPSLNVESLRTEILTRWDVQSQLNKKAAAAAKESQKGAAGNSYDKTNELFNGAGQLRATESTTTLDAKLEKLLHLSPSEKVTVASGSSSKGPKEIGEGTDSALRAAILKQYLQDDDSDEDEGNAGQGSSSGLEKNTNAERVLNDQKEIKEQAKAEAAKKRERDKEDRARQKKSAEERKEKAKKKATKVERKR